jgi:hypothetical protein
LFPEIRIQLVSALAVPPALAVAAKLVDLAEFALSGQVT